MPLGKYKATTLDLQCQEEVPDPRDQAAPRLRCQRWVMHEAPHQYEQEGMGTFVWTTRPDPMTGKYVTNGALFPEGRRNYNP